MYFVFFIQYKTKLAVWKSMVMTRFFPRYLHVQLNFYVVWFCMHMSGHTLKIHSEFPFWRGMSIFRLARWFCMHMSGHTLKIHSEFPFWRGMSIFRLARWFCMHMSGHTLKIHSEFPFWRGMSIFRLARSIFEHMRKLHLGYLRLFGVGYTVKNYR